MVCRESWRNSKEMCCVNSCCLEPVSPWTLNLFLFSFRSWAEGVPCSVSRAVMFKGQVTLVLSSECKEHAHRQCYCAHHISSEEYSILHWNHCIMAPCLRLTVPSPGLFGRLTWDTFEYSDLPLIDLKGKLPDLLSDVTSLAPYPKAHMEVSVSRFPDTSDIILLH